MKNKHIIQIINNHVSKIQGTSNNEVVHPEFTAKDSVMLSLSSLMAIPIDNIIEHCRSIDFRYRKGQRSQSDFSLQIWSAYLIYCKYMHIVDVEWLNMLESHD